jgi:hypothetical protein
MSQFISEGAPQVLCQCSASFWLTVVLMSCLAPLLQQINISATTLESINKNIDKLSSSTFDMAHREIFSLMKKDPFRVRDRVGSSAVISRSLCLSVAEVLAVWSLQDFQKQQGSLGGELNGAGALGDDEQAGRSNKGARS